ncbi:conserved hypothetical protein [Candidatus Magnetomoraceae bacterium gMMP-15]
MNTIQTFKEYEDSSGELRGDKYEGLCAIYQPDKIQTLKMGNHCVSPSSLTSPIVIYGDDLLSHNVFCLYSLNTQGFDSVSSETLTEFKRALGLHTSCFGLGNYCVYIYNPAAFISRCQSTLNNLYVTGNMGLVEYVDENEFHGKLPENKLGFQKRSLFKQQREYRIKVDTGRVSPEPYILDIGDINDISGMYSPQEFNEQLKIRLPDGSIA